MARVKRGVTSHAKHKKVLKAAKGYYGRRKNTIDRLLRAGHIGEPAGGDASGGGGGRSRRGRRVPCLRADAVGRVS